MLNDYSYLFDRYLEFYPFFIPLGAIGIWRWSVWFTKRIVASFYKPTKAQYQASVSVVTPVYNEDPETFTKTLESWKKNSPKEIIAVIDYTDKACIGVFKNFAKSNPFAKLIVTKIPGKRSALAEGIQKAKGEIVALVDSDTLWSDKVLRNGILPFKDEKIAGVATRQSVENPKTLAQKLFSMRLEQRYWDDIPFLATSGNVLICLSGRTAFYRRKIILPLLDKMVNETFMGKKVISGEDKRLTYLVQAAGWKTTYQSTAHVFTLGEKALKTLIKQQIRWTRNSWRAELGAIRQGWIFRHPVFTLYTFDRVIQPFTLLISPIYFLVSLAYGLWLPVLTILVWWLVSRGIKMYPHLRRNPSDIVILPLYILFSFVSAYIRIYALFSLNDQGWLTRWDKSRLPKFSFVRVASANAAALFLGIGLAGGIFYQQQAYVAHLEYKNRLVASVLPTSQLASANLSNVLGASTVNETQLLVKKYYLESGESLGSIAEKFGVEFDDLLEANVSRITDWSAISPGTMLNIPPKGLSLTPQNKFNYQRIYPDVLIIAYDPTSDTVIVSGRGKQITLRDIKNQVGEKYLREISPKVWYLAANLYLRSGVTLELNKNEVTQLKMASNKDKFVALRAFNGTILINGVKITSWDEKKNDVDRDYKDGRSFILVKDGSRMDIVNSELAYLGYDRPFEVPYSTYGVSWRMSLGKLGTTLLTGDVTGSKFHNNYFGAYTFGATGMTWKDNEFFDNVRYGLDPHDDSSGFLVENNKFYNNGSHGLIFSKRVIYNLVRNNQSYDNKGHGIMLHELSDSNIIENNQLWGNTNGVALDHSSKNIIRNNVIYQNKHGVRLTKGSKENVIETNKLTDNKAYGIYLYGNSDSNLIRGNTLVNNLNGMYIKTNKNELANNVIDNNQVGVYLLGQASGNKLLDNQITHNKWYGVYAKISNGFSNLLGQNNAVQRNKEDTSAYEFN